MNKTGQHQDAKRHCFEQEKSLLGVLRGSPPYLDLMLERDEDTGREDALE